MRLSYSSDQDDEKPRSKRVPENLRKEMEAYVASLFKDHEKKILAKTEDLVKSNEEVHKKFSVMLKQYDKREQDLRQLQDTLIKQMDNFERIQKEQMTHNEDKLKRVSYHLQSEVYKQVQKEMDNREGRNQEIINGVAHCLTDLETAVRNMRESLESVAKPKSRH